MQRWNVAELCAAGQPRAAVSTWALARAAQVHDLFGHGEDAGLAGDYQEAVGGIAAEPARPLEAAGVDGAIEAVPGQRIGNDTG